MKDYLICAGLVLFITIIVIFLNYPAYKYYNLRTQIETGRGLFEK